MAAEDKKISSLSEWIYENIVNAANIVVAHAGTNYRIAMSTLKQYVLGDRNIGGIGSGDIVTTTDEQILTGKRIDEPSFNDSVKLSWDVTATQMNHLSGLSQNVQNALNSIGGDILTIENSIENLNGEVDALQEVLGDREIGGTDSGDIVTTDDAQTLTNKTLWAPSFNGVETLNTNVTATQMNFLQNLDVNVKETLDTIGGDIGTIANGMANLNSTVDALSVQADKIYLGAIVAGSTSETIHASSISEYKINPYSLSISVYESTSGLSMKLLNLSNINILISGDYDILSSITIGDVVVGGLYMIVIRYRLAE